MGRWAQEAWITALTFALYISRFPVKCMHQHPHSAGSAQQMQRLWRLLKKRCMIAYGLYIPERLIELTSKNFVEPENEVQQQKVNKAKNIGGIYMTHPIR